MKDPILTNTPLARRDFFEHQGQREVVHARTAMLFRNTDAVGAELRQTLVHVAWEVVLLVPFRGVGPDLFLGKLAHRVADHFLVVCEQHVFSSLCYFVRVFEAVVDWLLGRRVGWCLCLYQCAARRPS